MATIGSHYVRTSLYGATQRGLNAHQLLKQAGIRPQVVENEHSRVDATAMARLIQLIWSGLQDEFMGFTSRPCANGVFALMCDQVKHCLTLEDMLRTGTRFYNLFTQDIQMTVEYQPASIIQTFTFKHPHHDPDHFYLEFWMSIWHRFSSWYIGEPIPLQEVHLAYPEPDYLEELKLVFPCKICFNKDANKIFYSDRFRGRSLTKSQQELELFLKQSPLALMTIPGGDQLLGARIRRRLESASHPAITTMQNVAQELNISVQGLNNRLAKEGERFQEIKDNMLCNLAIRMLATSDQSVDDISFHLGYTEARSFTRAFRRWTGSSPSEYRKLVRAQE